MAIDLTHVAVTHDLKNRLEKLKLCKHEPYYCVIERLLKKSGLQQP